MGTSKHTPGPWVRGEGLTIWARGKKLVAIASRSLREPSEEEEANATLATAAPELLAMLRECRATFAFAADGDDDPANSLIAEIDAVLAKAEEGK